VLQQVSPPSGRLGLPGVGDGVWSGEFREGAKSGEPSVVISSSTFCLISSFVAEKVDVISTLSCQRMFDVFDCCCERRACSDQRGRHAAWLHVHGSSDVIRDDVRKSGSNCRRGCPSAK